LLLSLFAMFIVHDSIVEAKGPEKSRTDKDNNRR